MTWTKLDDGIFSHPKMVKAGEDAANLYVRALVYCNRYLTDGRIEAELLPAITTRRDAAKLAAALVRVGAWEVHLDGGWAVHDFHAHNPTAEEVEARRAAVSAKRSEAGKRGGLRSGEARSNEAKAKQLALEATKQNEANDDEATKQNASPVPSRPVPTREEGDSDAREPVDPKTAEPPPVVECPTVEHLGGVDVAALLDELRRVSGDRVSRRATTAQELDFAALVNDLGRKGTTRADVVRAAKHVPHVGWMDTKTVTVAWLTKDGGKLLVDLVAGADECARCKPQRARAKPVAVDPPPAPIAEVPRLSPEALAAVRPAFMLARKVLTDAS